MATLQGAPTRHRHTEQFSGILTDQYFKYLALTSRGRWGWVKPKHKCEELQANNCVYKSRGIPARGIGPPSVYM